MPYGVRTGAAQTTWAFGIRMAFEFLAFLGESESDSFVAVAFAFAFISAAEELCRSFRELFLIGLSDFDVVMVKSTTCEFDVIDLIGSGESFVNFVEVLGIESKYWRNKDGSNLGQS